MSRRGLILFLALGVAWGIPYLLIKVAVGELSPAMVVFSRSALASVLLLPLAFARGDVAPVLRRWPVLLIYTLVEIIVPWYCLSSAEEQLPSSIAGLLIASVPLVSIGVAFLLGRGVRLSLTNWLGIAVGMGGVAAIVGLDVGGSHIGPLAKMAVVAIGYAVGPAILGHWLSDVPAIGVVALSLTITAVVYVPIVLLSGGFPDAWPSAKVISSVVTLAVVCSATAFLLMIALIAQIGPVRTTAITYVNPAVAMLAGAIFLNEKLTVWAILGLVLVLVGSYLVTHRKRNVVEEEFVLIAESEAPAVVEC